MAVSQAPPLLTLFGREREVARGEQLIADARDGCGALLLISGEAGIGKTALAAAISGDARARGATVHVGRCYDLTETPPYGPWVELFAQFPTGAGTRLLPAVDTAGEVRNEAKSARNATTVPPFCCVRTLM